jgi:hypothetical protein
MILWFEYGLIVSPPNVHGLNAWSPGWCYWEVVETFKGALYWEVIRSLEQEVTFA